MIINQKTQQILAVDFCRGGQHDFQLFKDSRCTIARETCVLADSGYQGLAKFYPNSQTPVKKTKLHPLTEEEKNSNRALSRKRIFVENVIFWSQIIAKSGCQSIEYQFIVDPYSKRATHSK